MPYVNDADVQIHLPVDILKVEDIPDDKERAYEDTERVIRGALAGVVEGTVLDSWITPETTPAEIRAIAGRLTAALIYRLRFGQGRTQDPEYAQNKYAEAMSMIEKIVSGAIVIPGVDVGTDFDNTWFEPNDASLPPFFVMGAQF